MSIGGPVWTAKVAERKSRETTRFASTALAVRVSRTDATSRRACDTAIMSDAHDDDVRPPRRLRVPATLFVAFVGSATWVGMSYGGCHEPTDPIDAGMVERPRVDAGGDGALADANDDPVDAARDAAPDTPVT